MNLTLDPWIPVIGAGAVPRLLTLQETFASAHEIRDLAVKPHEKIALLRLLVCISQAALDGPENIEDWETCGRGIQARAKDYLEQWQGSFELFGDGPRFLQVPGLKPGKEESEGNAATKLDLTLASGNNSFLFDNAAANKRIVTNERLALTLLAYQVMAPCSIIGEGVWGASRIPKCTAKHAPGAAGSMLHTFLHGDNLLSTIHLNLLNKEEIAGVPGGGWGRPVWEMPVNSAGDKAAITNATTTYLGRLAPLSRAVRLDARRLSMVLANGLNYPLFPVFREPAATVVPRKEGPGILGVSLGRSIWRQLSAITVKRRFGGDQLSGPLALKNLDDNRDMTLWIGALATDKAKIEDVVEASYDVPAGMFRDAGRKLYEEGIALADAWQDAVWKSVKDYATTLKLEPPPYDRGRQHFWTLIEQHVPKLLKLAGDPENAGDLAASVWGKEVKRAAYSAYEFACPHQSPRQIEAFAIGQRRLFVSKPGHAAAKPPKKSARLQTA